MHVETILDISVLIELLTNQIKLPPTSRHQKQETNKLLPFILNLRQDCDPRKQPSIHKLIQMKAAPTREKDCELGFMTVRSMQVSNGKKLTLPQNKFYQYAIHYTYNG